jgi:transglutaminase/protease-like cytokinesis protein 3
MASSSFVYDVPQTLRTNTFTNPSFTFTGWAESPDGIPVFTNEQSVNNLTTVDGDVVTLYAVWEAITVTGVMLNKTGITLAIGETEKLIPTIYPNDAFNKNVTWSSGDDGKATVSADGTVTAVSPGTITITVTTVDGGKTAECIVTVLEPESFTITFTQITDAAPSISGPTLFRISNAGPTAVMLTVESPDQYDSINWRVNNTTVTGTGASFTLSAANTAYNFIGEHFVTVMVIKSGMPYNKTVSFRIEY